MEIENSNFVEIEEGLWVPIGFRFRPTDEELVVDYLKSKIYSLPLPSSVIQEHQVFNTNPWDLPGDLKEKRYFFSKKMEKLKNSRNIVCGYWKKIGRDKPVVASISMNHDHEIVGMKRTSVFCQKKCLQKMKSCWIMQQYFLLDSSKQNRMVQSGDWVVCSIYQERKSGARKKSAKKQESNRQRMIERIMRRLITNFNHIEENHKNNSFVQEGSSTSCSSGVTEIVTSPDC